MLKKIKREKRGEAERKEAQKSAQDVTYETEKKENLQQTETAQKEKEEKLKTRWRFADLFAFFALLLAAILIAVGPFVRFFLAENGTGQRVYGILITVAQYIMLAAVALPAWYFVRKKSGFWTILLIIIIVVYIVGTIIGLI